MKENWRLTLFSPALIPFFGILYAATLLIDILAWRFGAVVPYPVFLWRIGMLGLFSAVCGLARGAGFNPAHDTAYWRWLALTPWSVDKPLPKGPVHLIWTDGIALALLSLLAYSNIVTLSAVPIVAFLAAYLLPLCVSLAAYQMKFLVPVLFLAPLTWYPFKDLFVAGFVLVGLYILVSIGTHRFLKGFPWNTGFWQGDLVQQLRESAIQHNVVGWPFNPLCIFDAPGIKTHAAFVLSLLFTWYGHIFFWSLHIDYDTSSHPLLFVTGLIAFLVALMRFVAYRASGGPPLNWRGRILTGRLIIPGYDKIYIAPLCIAAAGIVLPATLRHLGLPIEWTLKVSSFVVLFLALALPPTLKSWRLTGAYQVARPLQRQQSKPTTSLDQNLANLIAPKITPPKK